MRISRANPAGPQGPDGARAGGNLPPTQKASQSPRAAAVTQRSIVGRLQDAYASRVLTRHIREVPKAVENQKTEALARIREMFNHPDFRALADNSRLGYLVNSFENHVDRFHVRIGPCDGPRGFFEEHGALILNPSSFSDPWTFARDFTVACSQNPYIYGLHDPDQMFRPLARWDEHPLIKASNLASLSEPTFVSLWTRAGEGALERRALLYEIGREIFEARKEILRDDTPDRSLERVLLAGQNMLSDDAPEVTSAIDRWLAKQPSGISLWRDELRRRVASAYLDAPSAEGLTARQRLERDLSAEFDRRRGGREPLRSGEVFDGTNLSTLCCHDESLLSWVSSRDVAGLIAASPEMRALLQDAYRYGFILRSDPDAPISESRIYATDRPIIAIGTSIEKLQSLNQASNGPTRSPDALLSAPPTAPDVEPYGTLDEAFEAPKVFVNTLFLALAAAMEGMRHPPPAVDGFDDRDAFVEAFVAHRREIDDRIGTLKWPAPDDGRAWREPLEAIVRKGQLTWDYTWAANRFDVPISSLHDGVKLAETYPQLIGALVELQRVAGRTWVDENWDSIRGSSHADTLFKVNKALRTFLDRTS